LSHLASDIFDDRLSFPFSGHMRCQYMQ